MPSCDQKAYGTDRANICLKLKLKLTSFLENVLLLGSNEIIRLCYSSNVVADLNFKFYCYWLMILLPMEDSLTALACQSDQLTDSCLITDL